MIPIPLTHNSTPTCELEIPVVGGSVKNPKKDWTISAGVYRLVISGIALASVNGTKGASRNPKPSHQSFVFDSPDTTGAVTLDLETSASREWLKVELKRPGDKSGLPLIDTQLGNLEKKILTFFETPPQSIQWDLAQINNSRPSAGSTQLVPERFRFAVYTPDDDQDYTILSLFIHIKDRVHGRTEDKLQENWGSKWSKAGYGVPPIPQSYTASVIFNNAWIKDSVETSVLRNQGLKIEAIPKTSSDTWGLKW